MQKLCDEMVSAVDAFRDMLEQYLSEDNSYKSSVEKVRTHEVRMDDIRREMEQHLFKFELLKYSQSDKLRLVEALDDVADRAETTARVLSITKPKIPKKLTAEFRSLMDLSFETVEHLSESVMDLYEDFEGAKRKAHETESLRRRVRAKEFALLEKVFKEKPNTNSLLLKEFITQIGKIADDAEKVADMIAMMSVKYRG